MGKIKKHPPLKLIIAFIFKEESIVNRAKGLLERRFGAIDFQSNTLDFLHTDYYAKEMGRGLKRRFISFKRLIPERNLYKIKIATNNLEQKLAKGGIRRINIDPGYLDLSKLILFSTKDYKHRIYLGSGIYAEVTLFYENKSFRSWEWTYPDYKSHEYIVVFNQIREIYATQIKDN